MGGKNQHYVPQFYLRQFKTPESREGKERVHTYFKEKDRYIGDKMVEDIASENWFYRITAEKPQIIDDSLTALENRVAPLLKKLIEAKTTDGLTYSDLHDLALFLSAQHYRTRKFRDLEVDSLREILVGATKDPKGFEAFIKENSRYTRPLIEQRLSNMHIDIATRRLEVMKLSPEERDKQLPALDEELRQFESSSAEVKAGLDLLERGQVPEGYLEGIEQRLKVPTDIHAQAISSSIPKFAERLLGMEWSIQRYADDVYRYTSDNPLVLFPLSTSSSKDAEAFRLVIAAVLGEVDFYLDELVDTYPPIAFFLPITPHLDLVVAPHSSLGKNGGVQSKRNAFSLNTFQLMQAKRFIFSGRNNFSDIPKMREEESGWRRLYH